MNHEETSPWVGLEKVGNRLKKPVGTSTLDVEEGAEEMPH